MFGFKWSMVQLVLLFTWAQHYCTFGSVVLWYTLTACLGVALVLTVTTYDHDYWRKRGVFSPPAWPLVGHIRTVVSFKEQGGMCFKRIYDKYKHHRFLGTHQFYQRTLVVCDPDLIKRVCVNDFQHFVDRGFFFNKDVDPLAGSVLFLRGNEWRKLRAKISPIFSPNKLRGMFPLIENTASEFVQRLQTLVQKHPGGPEGSVLVDSEKLVGGYTADAIVPCAFGLKSNVMDNDDDPFAAALHAFYEMSWYNIFEKTMRQFWPAFALFFRMRIIPKKTHDFFYNIVTSVLRARENGDQEKRGDFIDMMMAIRSDQKNNNSDGKVDENDVEITDIVICANAFIIFLGGFETTSSTLAFMLLELAANQQVQDKMRAEISQVLAKHHGKVSYEVLQDLTYMEMVIQETLRLYPPFPSIQRLCTKEYVIPGTKIVVERGTIVLFPTLGIQRDEQYFEDASAFVPERWAEGRPQPPPGVYMPFGDGPRYCIGKRFAMIQMKCCLVRVLPRVRVLPARSGPRAAARAPPGPRAAARAPPGPRAAARAPPGPRAAARAPPGPRAAPPTPDPRSPLTLHPADSRVRIALL